MALNCLGCQSFRYTFKKLAISQGSRDRASCNFYIFLLFRIFLQVPNQHIFWLLTCISCFIQTIKFSKLFFFNINQFSSLLESSWLKVPVLRSDLKARSGQALWCPRLRSRKLWQSRTCRRVWGLLWDPCTCPYRQTTSYTHNTWRMFYGKWHQRTRLPVQGRPSGSRSGTACLSGQPPNAPSQVAHVPSLFQYPLVWRFPRSSRPWTLLDWNIFRSKHCKTVSRHAHSMWLESNEWHSWHTSNRPCDKVSGQSKSLVLLDKHLFCIMGTLVPQLGWRAC